MTIETLFQYNRSELLYIVRVSRRRWSRGRYLGAASLMAAAIMPHWPPLIRGILAGASLALTLLTELRLRRNAWLAMRHERNNPRTLTITDEAFSSRSGAMTRSLAWAEMHSARRKGDWWYLHFAEKQFLLLPMRAFNDEQRAEFEKMLVNRGGGKLISS